jgi:prolipoprotein diacylglyceryl transferase
MIDRQLGLTPKIHPASILARPNDASLFSLDPRRAFGVCGGLGFAIGMPLAMLMTAHLGLSLRLTAGAAFAGIAALLATGMAPKIFTGEECFVYFRDILPIFVVIAVIIRVMHQPVLIYLDIMTVGAGAFHACGRIGCLLVGCCHGRPSRWGIRYCQSHAECGFASYYLGVRLFPIQAVESLFVFCLVAIGTVILWKGTPPGSALAFYIVAYALGRFFIEFARGDAARPYFAGFSEAQWTSLLLVMGVAFAERGAILPASRWHGLAALGIGVCMALLMAWRRFDGSRRFELLQPRHVDEIIGSLELLEISPQGAGLRLESIGSGKKVHVVETSLGYRISVGKLSMGIHSVKHYTLSNANGISSRTTAAKFARLIARVKHDSSPYRIFQGGSGTFHVLFTFSE